MTAPESGDLLDLNSSHEPDNTQTTTTQAQSGIYPAFQSIDDLPNDENAPMLGQISPSNNGATGQMNSPITVTVNPSNPSVNSTSNTNINNTNNNNNISNNISDANTYGATTNKDPSTARCWQIEYYQAYFNVDTMSLLSRLRKTMIPTSPIFDKELNEEADLYGPFWIVSTLVFLMAAMGNLSRFLNSEKTDTAEWESDIKKISEAATLLYSVSAFIPFIVYFVFRNWNVERGFIELIAIYGYSMLPFIPACVLCVIPWALIQWAVVFGSFGVSIWFLVKNLYLPLAEDKRPKPGYYVLGLVLVVQLAISLALKMYFFDY